MERALAHVGFGVASLFTYQFDERLSNILVIDRTKHFLRQLLAIVHCEALINDASQPSVEFDGSVLSGSRHPLRFNEIKNRSEGDSPDKPIESNGARRRLNKFGERPGNLPSISPPD